MQVEVVLGRTIEDLESAGRKAAEVLGAGGLVVHPTETFYGIGGDGSTANNELLAKVKARSSAQPLILLIPDRERLRHLHPTLEWPRAADELARRFWPGPLTMVVPCAEAPKGLLGPGGGLAVRVTPHGAVSAIFQHWNGALTSTSANVADKEPPCSLEEALLIFEGRDELAMLASPVLAIDGGATAGRLASTIVSFVESPPRLLREGPIGLDELKGVLPYVRKTE